jgi:uncharacterized protein YjiS (DUF1127 family)
MDTISRTALPAARLPGRRQGGAWGFARRVVLGAVTLLIVWQQRQADRDRLREMTEDGLRDIGVTHAAALQEANKPFWRA